MTVRALLLPALVLASQENGPAPSHAAWRLPDGTARPVIDAVLDEAAWAEAEPLTPLRQVEPVAGAEPSERTEVRIVYDARSLFLGIRCFDREPALIRATQMKRDANLDPDDRVEILLDTFLDRRNAFWFQIGAAGSKGDALVTKNGSQFNKQWDTIWYALARVDAEGWLAEIEIPFASINFEPDTTVWGLNLVREIRRRSESARWASPDPRFSFFSVANAGTLSGTRGLEQGLGLDVKPFALGTFARDSAADDTDWMGDAGLDAFYKLSPSTKLSLSVNTDFAKTEVDERQVNLTRFPLFFPEKRDFFLEDSGVFFFGPSAGFGRQSDVIPFFSRRIGLDDEGAEVPLLAAAKITGQTGSYSFGLLDVQTDESAVLDGRNLFAGRFSKNVLEQSDVGLIWTHGDPLADERSDTMGVDFNYRTDEFLDDRSLRLSAYALKTDSEGVSGDDTAWHASAAYPNDEIEVRASFTSIGEDFDPALGFVPRTGIRKYSGEIEYSPRLYSSIRQLRFGFEPTWITNTSGDTETAEFDFVPFGVEWESGDRFDLRVSRVTENLDEDFDIQDDVVVPLDDYDFVRHGASFRSSDKRDLAAVVAVTTGGFFDGSAGDYYVELDWRPSARMLYGLAYSINDVRLPGGDFSVHLARLRADFLFDPDTSWSSFVQWDDESNSLSLNSRLWWIIEPGNELFLVLNHGWDVVDSSLSPTSIDVTLKLGYTLRF